MVSFHLRISKVVCCTTEIVWIFIRYIDFNKWSFNKQFFFYILGCLTCCKVSEKKVMNGFQENYENNNYGSKFFRPNTVFRRQTRYSNDCAKHPFFLQIPKAHHKFHETSFIPRTTKLWNSLPPEAFPDEYNINKFKSNANKFLLTSN